LRTSANGFLKSEVVVADQLVGLQCPCIPTYTMQSGIMAAATEEQNAVKDIWMIAK